MDTDTRAPSWLEPALVSASMLLPSLVPYGSGVQAGGAVPWLASGAAQALSQLGLLLVIIGARGRLRDYGVARPSAADALAAVPLALAMGAAALAASGLAAILMPGLAPGPGSTGDAGAAGTAGAGWAAAFTREAPPVPTLALAALCALFAAAVAYREELFYRLYVIGALRERGASAAAAAAVSALVFAAGHAYQGARGLAASLAVGALLAGVALRRRRLHALAWAHALYDFAVLASGLGLVGRG